MSSALRCSDTYNKVTPSIEYKCNIAASSRFTIEPMLLGALNSCCSLHCSLLCSLLGAFVFLFWTGTWNKEKADKKEINSLDSYTERFLSNDTN
jgi:hypothetical protein